jgi:hypothetical protein
MAGYEQHKDTNKAFWGLKVLILISGLDIYNIVLTSFQENGQPMASRNQNWLSPPTATFCRFQSHQLS